MTIGTKSHSTGHSSGISTTTVAENLNYLNFFTSKDITWQVDMDSGKLEKLGYDMIIGRDLLQDCCTSGMVG